MIASRICRRAGVHYVRASSLYSPAPATAQDCAFLASRLGSTTKLDAGTSVKTLEDAINAWAAGAERFVSVDPVPLLDAWRAELAHRAAAAQGGQPV